VFENNERRFITFRVRRDFTPETHTDVNLDGGQTASNKTAMELSGAVIDAIPLETGASVEASRSPEPRALSDDAGGKSLSQQDGEEGQGDEGVERVADGDDEAVWPYDLGEIFAFDEERWHGMYRVIIRNLRGVTQWD